ncbi:MAG TPA: Uma2 family endonuclease [Candidatus Binatia bacterium]|jgi:Uma2 family endonuclease|nr:Uma2 family endonuclease [Candidatus Binatia bacterium]
MPQTAFISTETFTPDEFEAWLADLPSWDENHYELINGSVVMTPPAGWPHGNTEARIVYALSGCARQYQLGEVFGSSTGYRLPSGDTLEPDVSFISYARLQAGPPPQRGKFLEIVPNLVVEILSTTTAVRDRTEKKAIYERNGVEEYWLVDTDRRSLIVFRLSADLYGLPLTFGPADVLTSAVLPQLSLLVSEVFV